ncbi:hypothetical protein JCM24511_06415 [Saitozyma sp. JCM 24511]|nr:hypothetical protein JCM24511_06415 [Saitozyma sp. JCM 24511]
MRRHATAAAAAAGAAVAAVALGAQPKEEVEQGGHRARRSEEPLRRSESEGRKKKSENPDPYVTRMVSPWRIVVLFCPTSMSSSTPQSICLSGLGLVLLL